MNTIVDDLQVVTDTQSVLFSLAQQGIVNVLTTLQNVGANPITYVFQEFDGANWYDIGSVGSPTNNSLQAGQSVSLILQSSYSQVRLQGFANGGSTLSFTLTRLLNRISGGAVPLLTI
jgi:hypothetical protein